MAQRGRWTVRAFISAVPAFDNNQYHHLRLRFSRKRKIDAGKEVEHAALLGYDLDYYTKRAQELREKTGGHEYWDGSSDDHFEIIFQSNNPTPYDWYGGRIDSAGVSRFVGRAIVLLAENKYQLTPEKAIELLRAIPIEYIQSPSSMSLAVRATGDDLAQFKFKVVKRTDDWLDPDTEKHIQAAMSAPHR